MFEDRNDAGMQLAEKLEAQNDPNVIVFAIPRGGIIIADVVCEQLKFPHGHCCLRGRLELLLMRN